ncbi:hypothetical protein LOZ53_003418 [Ophidiomyces ophidiicola]|nr:hypothetical protein LOZ55_003151 [Ophidiomyces ophidiicola]KAI1981791.1 hypothetical protein LOZ54_005506 [Ophidiomyces ophidiicola]KAI1987081.1 hypothetical protein LOZ51_005854 [Ophidiomyces ophidiicola]KAI1989950.1 hypothetical protein LOZ53_003418 [Ophidiomyces ophidiicola]
MSLSPEAFARLTPSNTQAKLAFDAMYEADPLITRQQVFVQPQQEYSKAALIYRLQEMKLASGEANESDTPTDPDTDTEEGLKHHGMIWSGWFEFKLNPGPYAPGDGWTLGKGRNTVNVDFCLPSPRVSTGLRGLHALFNFHSTTGYLFISKVTGAQNANVSVNGNSVGYGEQYSLNQNPMRIRIGLLEFECRYTEFAHTQPYYINRTRYFKDKLQITSFPNTTLTPTPSTSLQDFGHWTLMASLGSGTYGKVFSGTNSKGEIVAVKIITRDTKNVQELSRGIKALREIQNLPEIHAGDNSRILHLREVIYQDGAEINIPKTFEQVALILEPAVHSTFASICGHLAYDQSYNIPSIADLFYEALLGLNFLHSHNWIHSDIKPNNIGISIGGAPRAVLLDLDNSIKLQPGCFLPATPGQGGTVNYLAPERELQEHDSLVDVWSMGIVGFELLYRYHPWKLALNPWRSGEQFETWRPAFHRLYGKTIQKLEHAADFEFAGLLLQMLCFPWAKVNSGTRITIGDALKHACWQKSESDGQPPLKRVRQELGK